MIGGDQPILLEAQFGGHLVEGGAEIGEIAFRRAHGHLNVKVAGGDLICRGDQTADRTEKAIGEARRSHTQTAA